MPEWYDTDPDRARAKREREKARALRATDWWRDILAKGVCRYCGRRVGADALTMDHVIPIARGGRSVKSNIVPCCKDCNSKKGLATPAEKILEDIFGPDAAP